MYFRTVTDMQNRLIRIAGGLLITLSLLGCSTYQPHLMRPPIEISLTISPGQGTKPNTDACTFSPLSGNIVVDQTPTPGSDSIRLDSKTGELDLVALNVAPHNPNDPSRHLDIKYTLAKPPSDDKQYSIYFTNDNLPLVAKDSDPLQPEQLKKDTFHVTATSVKVTYQNVYKEGYETFKFYIIYTIVKTLSGGGHTPPYIGRCDDPNIRNTPV
jgi:hypothetical protein